MYLITHLKVSLINRNLSIHILASKIRYKEAYYFYVLRSILHYYTNQVRLDIILKNIQICLLESVYFVNGKSIILPIQEKKNRFTILPSWRHELNMISYSHNAKSMYKIPVHVTAYRLLYRLIFFASFIVKIVNITNHPFLYSVQIAKYWTEKLK